MGATNFRERQPGGGIISPRATDFNATRDRQASNWTVWWSELNCARLTVRKIIVSAARVLQ
jgi:hypothetical protein